MSLCQFRTALGVPGKGAHTHFAGVAVTDLVLTLAAVWLIVYFTKWDFSLVAGVAFLLAFVLHKVFCIRS